MNRLDCDRAAREKAPPLTKWSWIGHIENRVAWRSFLFPRFGVVRESSGIMMCWTAGPKKLRGAWSDRDTNDIFAHCSLIFHFLDFKFSNFICPSELHPLIWFFCKNFFGKMKNIRKTTKNALAPSIFIVLSIVLKLGTPLLHTQAQNTLLQIF